jgi:hypothetical protein
LRLADIGRMPPAVPLLQPSATGLGGNLRNYTPGSAGNEARDTDIPRRLRIRARHIWNPSVTDVIVNTLRALAAGAADIGFLFTTTLAGSAFSR